jgi:transcriptional regulator with XRE-family HTH domain
MNKGTEIGMRVKEARERAGLSIGALAKRAGMSRAYVGLLEAGKIPAITVARLSRIAAASNAQLEHIISEAEYSPEQRVEQHTQIIEDLVNMSPGTEPQVARTFVEGLLHLNREDQAQVADLITSLARRAER